MEANAIWTTRTTRIHTAATVQVLWLGCCLIVFCLLCLRLEIFAFQLDSMAWTVRWSSVRVQQRRVWTVVLVGHKIHHLRICARVQRAGLVETASKMSRNVQQIRAKTVPHVLKPCHRISSAFALSVRQLCLWEGKVEKTRGSYSCYFLFSKDITVHYAIQS